MDKNGKLNVDDLLKSKLQKDMKKQKSIELKIQPVVAKPAAPIDMADMSKLMTNEEQA